VPICVKCPIPLSSDRARRANIRSSTVVLLIVVSATGRVARIVISKNPGFGLTDQEIESVSEWEFRPALDKEGKPVPVEVPTEITYNLKRN
jgi:TonB family protein